MGTSELAFGAAKRMSCSIGWSDRAGLKEASYRKAGGRQEYLVCVRRRFRKNSHLHHESDCLTFSCPQTD